MSEFPKKVSVRGIEVEVASWDELDEIVNRYGGTELPRQQSANGRRASYERGLSHSETTLLQMFVENGNRGILNKDIGPALGAQGKGIRPALDRWSRKIGLVTEEEASAFESVNMGVLGRGWRMTDVFLKTARSLLGTETRTPHPKGEAS